MGDVGATRLLQVRPNMLAEHVLRDQRLLLSLIIGRYGAIGFVATRYDKSARSFLDARLPSVLLLTRKDFVRVQIHLRSAVCRGAPCSKSRR